jgi:hypothetical protein
MRGGRPGRWRAAWPLAVAAGLVLAGRALLGEVGSPVAQLRALQSVGHPWADPVAPMLSLMALLAEALAGYLLVVLPCGSSAGCRGPGGAPPPRGGGRPCGDSYGPPRGLLGAPGARTVSSRSVTALYASS